MSVLEYSENTTEDLLIMLRMFINDTQDKLSEDDIINNDNDNDNENEYVEYIDYMKQIIDELEKRNEVQTIELARTVDVIEGIVNKLTDC